MKRLFILGILFSAILFWGTSTAQNQPKSQVDRETVGITVQVNSTRVVVQNVAPRTSIQIYSILGVKLKEYKMPLNGDDLQFDLPKGCYILKTDEFVRKLAIK